MKIKLTQVAQALRATFGSSKPAANAPQTEADTPANMMKDTAWSYGYLYNITDFPKYNPDELVGRKGLSIYRKMMVDEQVKAVIRFKRDAITSRAYAFECEYDELSETERDARIKVMTEAVKRMTGSFSDTLNSIMSAMYMGYSMTEKVFKLIEVDGKNWYGIDHLRLKPQETFYFYTDAFGTLVKLTQRVNGSETVLDIKKFIHFVQNPEWDEHMGRSELRECYRDYFSKDMITKFQNIYLERFAGGFAWAQPLNGKTLVPGSLEYNNLLSVLTNINTLTSAIIPSNVGLNLSHPNDTKAFDTALTRCDKGIAKSLLVPNLLGISEQGTHGSLAQADSQLEAFLWTLEADTQRLEECLNEQLFKQLGDLNWGDNLYPVFKLSPISEKTKLALISTWSTLVKDGAVQASDTDEAFLRELLDFPDKGTPIKIAPPGVVPMPGGPDDPNAPGNQKPGTQPTKPGEQQPTKPGQDPNAPQKKPGVEQNMEETIMPEGRVQVNAGFEQGDPLLTSKRAFNRAMRRVDFAVIASQSEDSSQTMAYDIAVVNSDAVKRITDTILKDGATLRDATAIKFTGDELGRMKSAAAAGLKDAWDIGTKHAKRELAKASRQRKFAVDDLALMDLAAEYLKTKSFTITGNISNATIAQIQAIIAEGVKTSKTQQDIVKQIYKALESDGYLTDEAVQEALGTTTVKNTKARISTISRTASFDAINEARYNVFSEPALDGFVQALEYSAILDNVTTEICRALDGDTYAVDDSVWGTYRPPNHYNCRSILIPITERDTWTPSDPPTVEPQKGFGFERLARPAKHCDHD